MANPVVHFEVLGKDAGALRKFYGQPSHLREVAGGVLPTVVLPVGVCHEADRRVERQVPGHVVYFGRIQRQPLLRHKQQVQKQEAQHVQRQERRCVLLPVHFLTRIDTRDPVDPLLQRPEE